MANQGTQTGYIERNDGKLYYEIAGEGETVVLVQAAHVDSGMWDAQWDVLAEKYRVIRFDMRGYGKSDVLTAPVSRREEFGQVMDELQIDQAALIGCSLGGEVIIDYALEYPARVTALIAVSAAPSGFQMQGEPPRYMMDMFQALQQRDLERASDLQARIWVDGIYREPEQVDTAVRQWWLEMNRAAVSNNTYLMVDTQPVNPLDPPAVTRLSEIEAPTLIVVGSLDHPELSRAADVMQEQIPNAEKVVIADAAHMLNMEKPDEFNRIMLEFLAKH